MHFPQDIEDLRVEKQNNKQKANRIQPENKWVHKEDSIDCDNSSEVP